MTNTHTNSCHNQIVVQKLNSKSKRPNILLITSDQKRGDCYGFEGTKIKTSHLDQLAADGTRFSACITPTPFVNRPGPRFLTGQLPLTHGVHDNGIDLNPEVGEKGMACLAVVFASLGKNQNLCQLHLT